MKTINLLAILVLLISSCGAQVKNAKTETRKIYGNCGMCQKTIEKAGNIKKEAHVEWNRDSKMATITYDSINTDVNEVLKRIAAAGYDSEEFIAPNDVYNNLHDCCQYERNPKASNRETEEHDHSTHSHDDMTHDHHDATMAKPAITDTMTTQGMEQLYSNYFLLKDAFVNGNETDVFNYSGALYRTIKAIDMNSLKPKVHTVWMKKMKDLEQDASSISNTKGIEKQRSYLNRLSANLYELMKVEKPKTIVYYDHCPMANEGKGANWLSQEREIKNPYYGNAMLKCGSTIETIK